MKIRPYEELAHGIINQAAREYKSALCILAKHPEHGSARYRKREIERFFRSKWFSCLTDIDGKWLIKEMKKEFLK